MNQLQTDSQPAMTTLVTGIIQDAQDLMQQQLRLFQVEVKNDLRQTKEASVPLAIGALITLVGAVSLALAAAHLLVWIWPTLDLGGGFAIVGLVLSVVGLSFVLWGKCKFDSFNALPDKSLAGLKENLQWKTKM